MAFPIRPLTLAKFGAWLFLKEKLKTSTVSQYVAIMDWWHCIKGLPDPSKQLLIKRFLVGLRKEAPPPRQADPNRFGQVLKIIQELEASTPPAERVLLKVVFFLAYYASLRVSEYAATKAKHALSIAKVSFSVVKAELKAGLSLPSFKGIANVRLK